MGQPVCPSAHLNLIYNILCETRLIYYETNAFLHNAATTARNQENVLQSSFTFLKQIYFPALLFIEMINIKHKGLTVTFKMEKKRGKDFG